MMKSMQEFSQKFYISHKVAAVFVFQTLLVLALLFFNAQIFSEFDKGLTKVSDEDSVKTVKVMQLAAAVPQVQQWLQDVSTTFYTDGFEEAETWANEFRKIADELKQLEINTTNEKATIEKIEAVQENFEKFYGIGVEMTKAYLYKGRAAGNIQMETFDTIADSMVESMSELKDFYIEAQSNYGHNLKKDGAAKSNLSNVLAIVMMLAFGAIIFLLTNTLTKDVIEPVKEVVDAFKELEQGDLTVSMQVKGTAEIKELCTSFNQCVRTLHDSRERELGIKKDLENTIRVLVGSSSELDNTSNGLTITMNEVKGASDEVSNYINSVSVASEELISSISEISQNTDRAASMTKSAVEEIEATEAIVKTLQQRSEEIAGILKVVTEIANQTNLLALNATIEAARAGEAGKGFAVVANEVKELANRTTESTEDISNKIGAIQKETAKALTAIETATGSVRKINEVAITIAGAVEEQTAVTTEIGRSMQNSSAKVNEMAKSVESADSLVSNTKEKSSDLASVSNKLQELSSAI